MEQHRTRQQPQPRQRRGTPLPPQAVRGRPVPDRRTPAPPRPPDPAPAARALRRLPNPRLTGLGGALFCGLAMLVLGGLDRLLFEASLTVYGMLFLPVSVLTALWVRRADMLTAPVVVPIAFAFGLLPVADGDGLTGRLVGVITALAMAAGWLYGGTLLAGLLATVRRVLLMRRRSAARQQREQPARPPAQARARAHVRAHHRTV